MVALDAGDMLVLLPATLQNTSTTVLRKVVTEWHSSLQGQALLPSLPAMKYYIAKNLQHKRFPLFSLLISFVQKHKGAFIDILLWSYNLYSVYQTIFLKLSSRKGRSLSVKTDYNYFRLGSQFKGK